MSSNNDSWTTREIFVLRLFLLIILILKLVALVISEVAKFHAILMNL